MHRPRQFPYGKRTKALAPMHLSPGCADCAGRGFLTGLWRLINISFLGHLRRESESGAYFIGGFTVKVPEQSAFIHGDVCAGRHVRLGSKK